MILYYDIETDSKFAPYANLKMIGYQVDDEAPRLVDLTQCQEVKQFKEWLADPEVIKVAFNNINYDDIVLHRHGFPVNPINRHDVFLMAKTLNPMIPAYGLKFLNWYYFADPHEPERQLHAWLNHNGYKDLYKAPEELLGPYCLHDITQTVRLWRLFWPIIRQERHWKAYSQLELPMGEVLHEIILEGKECVNLYDIKKEINKLRQSMAKQNLEARKLTRGRVTNLGSTAQVADDLANQEFELEISDKGNLKLRKDDLLTLLDLDNPTNDQSRLARLTYEHRDTSKQLGYLNAYRRALLYELRTCAGRRLYRQRNYGEIPKSYSLSGARTRRILSSSRFGINFQNQNKTGKRIQLVPPGWLDVCIDSTQIENVVHMWKSHDNERINSYKKNPNWSEYVWLCNRILGGSRSREELENINSPANPSWSIYKQFKTCKLALNFGMGVSKFSRTNRISESSAKPMFANIHRACPAIKGLQKQIEQELSTKGYIQDPWGHIYTGNPDMAYKVVAYFVQGCGTGSVPKAMARAIWEVLQSYNDRFDTVSKVAVMTGLIHDEIGFRIHLSQPNETIIQCLRDCLWCMEEKFSPMFDNIPLRAKLSVSITNAAEAETLNHHQMSSQDWEDHLIEYIEMGRV